MPLAVEVADLVKVYGALRAVDGVSFQVEAGQIFGMLGPNGAGKSTTVEMIEGLRPADEGRIEVLGIDVRKHPRRVKERIGVQLQSTAFFKQLSPRQILRLFASFYPHSLPADELIGMVNLEEKIDDASSKLSGGQLQRLAIAAALVNDPAVIFLDEPTTGLDPQARRSLWEVIKRLRERGKTILLTTHYLEEAEQLCDRLVVIDHGKVIAEGTPAGLIAEHFERTTLEFLSDARLDAAALHALPAVDHQEEADGRTRLFSSDAAESTRALLELCAQRAIDLHGLSVHTATLEDVFLKLTGRRIRS
jgi:ABC-2 type transport system ATP-binding protein